MHDETPWYHEGLSFRCSQCGDCCRGEGFVWVNETEIESIARFLDIDRDEFGRRFLRRVGQSLSLTDNAEEDCIFWDQGCTIYPVRPTQCRTFPFWKHHLASPSSWASVGRVCPGVGEGRSYELVQIERLARGLSDT